MMPASDNVDALLVALALLSFTAGCNRNAELTPRGGDATTPPPDAAADTDDAAVEDAGSDTSDDGGLARDVDAQTPPDTDAGTGRDVADTGRSDASCADGGTCGDTGGECEPTTVDSPPMNGYWYGKGYHFEWSSILERKDWVAPLSDVVDQLGEPAVLGVGLSNNKWAHIRGATEEALLIDPVARWVNKNDGLSRYQKEGRYVYYVSWLFPGEVRSDLGREEAYRKAANGEFDDHYAALAQRFADHGIADHVIVRLHPEHNGEWQGWAGGNEENFKEAWRRYVEAMRAVDEDIRFAYSPSIHQSKQVALDAYPGDDYVDYLGLSGIHDGTHPNYEDEQQVCGEDCEYPNCSENCNDQLFEQAWNYYKTHEFGLDAAARFADDHDLPMAFLEWGLKDKNEYSGGDNPRFIRAMYQWMVDHDVHFQTTFEAKGKAWHLSGGNYPDSLAAYQDTFAEGAPVDHVAADGCPNTN